MKDKEPGFFGMIVIIIFSMLTAGLILLFIKNAPDEEKESMKKFMKWIFIFSLVQGIFVLILTLIYG